jgi:hypothetical protein
MSSSEITVSHIRRGLVVYDYDFNSNSEVNSESLYESSSSHNNNQNLKEREKKRSRWNKSQVDLEMVAFPGFHLRFVPSTAFL